jgi:hypothetical protein
VRLSSVIFPGGVHVAGQTRYRIEGDGWDVRAEPEGLVVRGPDGVVHWIPASKAESGVVAEQADASVARLVPRKR